MDNCTLQARGDVPEWFKTEYLAAVARLEQPLRNLRCRFRATRNGDDGEFEYDGEFFAKDGAREVVRVRQRRNGVSQQEESRVVCVTPAHFFFLDRALDGSSYLIRALDDGNDPKLRRWFEGLIEFTTNDFLEAALRMDDPVKMLLTTDTVVKMDVERIDRGGRRQVELRCEFSDACNYESARAILDPDLDFAVSDYEIVIRGELGVRSTRKGIVECERWVGNGYVFPKRVRIEGESIMPHGERYWEVQEIEFQEALLDKVDDSQFTLTAFGLPEVLAQVPVRSRDVAFELAEYTVTTSQPGEVRDLTVAIRNGSGRTVRIVGAAEMCGPAGCNRVHGLPVTIAPASAATIQLEVHTNPQPGEGVNEIQFFLDHPDIPVVKLRLRCIVEDRSKDDSIT